MTGEYQGGNLWKLEMTNILEINIREVRDEGFQSLVNGLCECIAIPREEFMSRSLRFLLMVIVKENRGKLLSKKYLSLDGILGRKVDRLNSDSAVYEVCKELARINNTVIDEFAGVTVLTLIKRTYKRLCPPCSKPTRLKRYQRDYLFKTEMIQRRRKNGSL